MAECSVCEREYETPYKGTTDICSESCYSSTIPRHICSCGSGNSKYPLKDGYGIFLTYACDDCEDEKLGGFRSDIMDRYDTDETIEPDNY